jgi:hypothetical protein
MRTALLLLFLVSSPILAGIIEHQAEWALPAMGKTIFMYGEEHTDPFAPEALAQREELALSIDAIGNTYEGPISCYLECDINVQKGLQEAPYFYLRNMADHGAYFEQWYVPLARTFGKEVGVGRMAISNFDIRDRQYAHFEHHLQALADGAITHDQVNFNALRTWGKSIDGTIQELFESIQAQYPKKMISYIKRDMESKKKQFYAMIDTQSQSKKRARYTYRALNQFYNYTDLLADFTILNKVARDPRDTIVINAGSAHTQNISRYFLRII